MPPTHLRTGQTVASLVSLRRYRIVEPIGRGGFGTTYLATRINRGGRSMGEVCLKTTRDQASWHREAHFGEALRGNRRVIQLHDAFPLVRRRQGRTEALFCLVVELAQHGTVGDYLERTGRAWSPERARREVMALLKVLDQLHLGRVTHRDITPENILVCGRGTLKLGDFGIARHQLGTSAPALDAVNEDFVSRRVRNGTSPRWGSVDDVFQMGQVLAMLLLGQADGLVTQRTLRRLDCSSALKAVVAGAIGPRRQRFNNASEMLAALAAAT